MRRNQYATIFSYTGSVIAIGGPLMLTPILSTLFFPDERGLWKDFAIPAFALSILGIIMWKGLQSRRSKTVNALEGGVIVLLSWTIIILFSSAPLMSVLHLSFTQAVFESVSGWTTTGLSVVDVTTAPRAILIWRSAIQLAGGAGLAILMISSIAGPIGPGLALAEGRTDQLVPNVIKSAKLVVTIYIGYAALGTLAYFFAGMSVFDAINHSFAAVSTGGFSTKPDSIGHWNSSLVEAVTIPLMFLGSLNFLTAYLLLNGKLRAVSRNGEIRVIAFILPACVFLVFFFVCRDLYPTLEKSARVAVFETTSALTTTGFSTVSYNNWAPFGWFALIVLMLIGGGACSTAGGIKQYRIYLLYKSFGWELKRYFLPRIAVTENYVWQGENRDYIKDDRIRQTSLFLFIYLISYVLIVGVLAAHGFSLPESLFEAASSLGTVGLSVGVTSASSPPFVLWTMILGMFLGRLEFFVVFVSAWKIFKDFSKFLLRTGH
jgi:trk system potassium uptake protein TrkH